MAKTRFGVMACEGQECESHDVGAPVVVFKNDRDTLSYSCDWCGRAPYARPGTGQYKEWERAMEKRGGTPAAPAVVPVPAAPAQPAPAPEKKSPASAGLLIG